MTMNTAKMMALLVGAVTAPSACATHGTVTGDIRTPGQSQNTPVKMRWHSDGDSVNQGTLTTTFPDGEIYTGPYTQVSADATSVNYQPMWAGWSNGWSDWGGGPSETFATVYSGRVIANLLGDRGGRIRCRFVLAAPNAGMAGGGQGECQTSKKQEFTAIIHDGN